MTSPSGEPTIKCWVYTVRDPVNQWARGLSFEPDFVDDSGYAKYSVYHWRRTDVHLGYFGYKEFVEEDWTGSRGEFMTRAARDEAYGKHPEALNFIIAYR
ncbi:hypothetical protein FB451DRAFT_1407703 [Mycena latifolia]|nr:hypothetical protein FB451DRAFT_1407703 [Mycena latifolia]